MGGAESSYSRGGSWSGPAESVFERREGRRMTGATELEPPADARDTVAGCGRDARANEQETNDALESPSQQSVKSSQNVSDFGGLGVEQG